MIYKATVTEETLKIIQDLQKTHSKKDIMVIKPALGTDKKNTIPLCQPIFGNLRILEINLKFPGQ